MTVVAERPALPTKRDEAWRYAPHRSLADLAFGRAPGGDLGAAELAARLPDLTGPRVVMVNGIVALEHSQLSASAELTLASLADVTSAGSPFVAGHVGLSSPQDAFDALNAEFGLDGAVIEVADGATIDTPIQIVHVERPGESVNATCAGVVIHLGAGSSATVVEIRLGMGDAFGGSNVRTTITLDADASLDHVVVQDVPVTQVHLSRTVVTQAASSAYHARSFNLGGAYGRLAFDVSLLGAGAHADLTGLYFGAGSQILDQQLNVVHAVEDCTSRQSFRGVLDDASTGVFNGGIDVRPGADGTDAEQANDNLILSERAEANTQPRLEILADEVACKHGATVGQLDDTALYYMRSRGIGADDARRLLINGFADQVIDEVPIPAVRHWLAARLGHDAHD